MRRGLTILLLGLMLVAAGSGGVMAAPQEQGTEPPTAEKKPRLDQTAVLLFGQIAWPGVTWFAAGNVVLCKDEHFRQIVAAVSVHTNGRFAQMVPPGKYYLRAVVDLNGDGKVGPGDGLGFYGVEEPSDRPRPLDLQPEGEAELTVIRIIFQFGPDRKLVRAKTGLPAVICSVTGQVESAQQTGATYVVLWSTTSDWFGYAARAGADGHFELKVPPGPYAVLAFCDANSDAVLDATEPGLVLLDDQGKPKVFSLLPCGELELGPLQLKEHFEPPRPRPDLPVRLDKPPAILALQVAAREASTAPWQVAFFADEKLTDLLLTARDWPGTWLALRPATYYVVCGLDVDEDGLLSPKDLIATTGVGKSTGGPGGAEQGAGKGRRSPVSLRPGQILSVALDRVARLKDDMFKTLNQPQEK